MSSKKKIPDHELFREAMADVRPLPGDGRFELQRLPAGTVILRIGTLFDLERGEAAVEQAVELAADETAEVELAWR